MMHAYTLSDVSAGSGLISAVFWGRFAGNVENVLQIPASLAVPLFHFHPRPRAFIGREQIRSISVTCRQYHSLGDTELHFSGCKIGYHDG
jgi:hypothetical protein